MWYEFEHPETGEIELVEFQTSDKKTFSKNGVEYNRVWSKPQINANGSRIDPYSSRKFSEKTGRMKGTYGDLLDYSAELSQKREEKNGIDPVKRKYFDDYEKRMNRKHHEDKPKLKGNSLFDIIND